LGFFNLPTVTEDIKAGRLKALAVTRPTRFAAVTFGAGAACLTRY